MRKKKLILAIVLAVLGVGLGGRVALADDCDCGKLGLNGTVCDEYEKMNNCEVDSEEKVSNLTKNVVNRILYVVGVIAVVMILYGGFSYITSAGDAAKVTKAKNVIIYAVVGLLIAVLAYAIVNFVIGKI